MDYPFRKICIFWHVLKHEFSDLKSFFSIQNIKKKSIFWLEYTKKTQMRKSLIFGKKPQIIPFGKSRCFALFKTFFFLVSESFFFIQNIKKQYFLKSPKNTTKKNFDFWTKTMDYPLRKMSLFFDFLKLWFSGLKFILFNQNIKKRSFIT